MAKKGDNPYSVRHKLHADEHEAYDLEDLDQGFLRYRNTPMMKTTTIRVIKMFPPGPKEGYASNFGKLLGLVETQMFVVRLNYTMIRLKWS